MYLFIQYILIECLPCAHYWAGNRDRIISPTDMAVFWEACGLVEKADKKQKLNKCLCACKFYKGEAQGGKHNERKRGR